MCTNDFDAFLKSEQYQQIERGEDYRKLMYLLRQNLPNDVFLDVEELLHEEIISKMEMAFEYACSLVLERQSEVSDAAEESQD